jgi:hypothetical protein
MSVQFGAKDPNDVDDFTLTWTPQLATGETVAGFAAEVVAGGVTVDSTDLDSPRTTARISGGTGGQRGQVRYRITTSTGRQLDQTIIFLIMEA